jgi:hypothetical protein
MDTKIPPEKVAELKRILSNVSIPEPQRIPPEPISLSSRAFTQNLGILPDVFKRLGTSGDDQHHILRKYLGPGQSQGTAVGDSNSTKLSLQQVQGFLLEKLEQLGQAIQKQPPTREPEHLKELRMAVNILVEDEERHITTQQLMQVAGLETQENNLIPTEKMEQLSAINNELTQNTQSLSPDYLEEIKLLINAIKLLFS